MKIALCAARTAVVIDFPLCRLLLMMIRRFDVLRRTRAAVMS